MIDRDAGAAPAAPASFSCPPVIAGIVLAAGPGARFSDGHKLLQPFRGEPLVVHGLRAALASALAPVALVVGYRADEVIAALGEQAAHPKLNVVHNPDWNSGRASSLRAGLHALPASAAGAVVYPGDMPCMSVALIEAVRAGCVRTGQVCFPLYNGRKGHPVAFPRARFAPLCALHGDQSGYALLRAAWDEAVKLERTDEETQWNVNTRADYARLLQAEG